MKEADWNDCLECNSAIEISFDQGKISSLLETSKGRISFLKEQKLKEDNANYIFEAYYSSILELLHALLIKNGFKVLNHICIGYYIRDVIKNEKMFRIFDDIRFKRNSLIYYGKKMDFHSAKETIEESEKLIRMLEEFL